MKTTSVVKLVDKRTRVVAVYGPLPPNGRRPRLLLQKYPSTPSETGAFCFQTKDRVAKFILPKGPAGDRILDLLDRHP